MNNKNQHYENYVICEVSSDEKDEQSIQIEREKEKFIKNLKKIYHNVFENFKKGNLIIYDLDIFSKLTEEKFISWATKNSPHTTGLFVENK
jgi:hypothetical protein